MSDNEEKASSPFDDQTDEDETIALSKDELDDILSEAEIVDEKKETQPVEAPEIDTEASSAFEEEPTAETPEEEFDISGEIDELTAEDLEKIELEESDLESFTEELESELGEEPEISEFPGLEEEGAEIPEGAEGTDTEGVQFEAGVEEEAEVDLDSYLDSVETDIDLDSLDLEGEGGLVEPPVLGAEEAVSQEMESGEIPEGEEIEGIEEEAFSEEAFPEEISLEEVGEEAVPEEFSVDELTTEEELPSEEALPGEVEKEEGEEDVTLMEPGGEEVIIPEESTREFETAESESGAEDLGFEGEITLDEEEEKILNEDFDLETLSKGAAESEEVVSVSGEELETMSADAESAAIDADLLKNISTVLKYMDTLLGNLPEDKIKEFSQSGYFSIYKDVFEKLNLVQG